MNYLAHGWRFVAEPYFLAGTAAPDWLGVLDRRSRLRSRTAEAFTADTDPILAAVARGIVQHHVDDARFHATVAFNELSLAFAVELRSALPGDEGFRPSFLGHILVELLLDAALAEDDPRRLERYYAATDALDAEAVAHALRRLATRPRRAREAEQNPTPEVPSAERFGDLVRRFSAERFLYDYLDDGRLLWRLNQVLRRVGLSLLPETLAERFPPLRDAVRRRRHELLPG